MNNLDSKTQHIAYSLGQSLEQKYKAEIMAARSTMLIYFTSPVGIGEHSNIVEALEGELDMIAKYQDQIDIINKYFKK